jgi:hypothetical protein
MTNTIRREWKVAFSKNGQSTAQRLAKWTLFLTIAATLYRSRFFWLWTVGLPLLCVGIHFYYRWMTNGWTRAWGGWDDLNFDDEDIR